jgi:hypothetical protein
MRTCLNDQNLIGLLYYDLLADVCILYNLTLFYSVSLIYFFWAATLLIFLVPTMQNNYLHVVSNTHLCQIFILHFVARIFGRKWYNFALLNAGESGKHQNLQAFFTLVNITYNFSKVRVGLPEACSSKAMI